MPRTRSLHWQKVADLPAEYRNLLRPDKALRQRDRFVPRDWTFYWPILCWLLILSIPYLGLFFSTLFDLYESSLGGLFPSGKIGANALGSGHLISLYSACLPSLSGVPKSSRVSPKRHAPGRPFRATKRTAPPSTREGGGDSAKKHHGSLSPKDRC